jgi:protein TonB
MYYLETGGDTHTRFRNAIMAAIAVHAALILGISFESASSAPGSTQIEVTLATRPSTAAPDDAYHIAQANQEGSGDEAEFNQITSANNLPAMAPGQQQALPQRSDPATQNESIVTTSGIARHVASKDLEEPEQLELDLDGISPEVDRLSREMASLQAEYDEQTRTYADKPRVRRLTSASARQSADAAYLLDWRQRLEAVGNKYYPQASVRYGIYGDVRLLVVIRKDGSLEDVKVMSSSGFAVLDEAAIKVVRMAAPYSPFPAELAATTDKLEIIRTWQYIQNELSSEEGT